MQYLIRVCTPNLFEKGILTQLKTILISGMVRMPKQNLAQVFSQVYTLSCGYIMDTMQFKPQLHCRDIAKSLQHKT